MVDVFDRHGVRFDPRLTGCSRFVRYSDYAALEAQLAERVKEVSRLQQALVRYGDRTRMAWAPSDLQQTIDDALSALEATPPAPKVTATHRHKKRGTEYVLVGFGKLQAEMWVDWNSEPVDMREVAIYRSVDDGSLWVRPREEFEDGRFEALTAAQEAGKP